MKKSTKITKTVAEVKKDPALTVICPRCGVFPGNLCVHTKGAKKGQKCLPHDERIRLAKVKASVAATKSETNEVPLVKIEITEKVDPKTKLTKEQAQVVKLLQEKIDAQNRYAEFIGPVTVGPRISTYRFFPLKKTKVAHLESMGQDFAVALGVEEKILVKRMPGESAIGVFVPNKVERIVTFQETLQSVLQYMQKPTKDGHKPIPLNLGVNSNGFSVVDDLTMQPHLLIAGATGGGKSTLEHAIVCSLLWAMSPEELKLIVSDTKGVEFDGIKQVPHLQFPICKNVWQTMEALDWAMKETQRRLDEFGKIGVRNIHDHNAQLPKNKMPYIVIVIDELADIMGTALDRSEAKMNSDKLSVIVGRSRASGIHCIVATQRPDVKMVKGQIKANLPSRISFRLPSHQDSRTVLNTKGAESLMTHGDMLYSSSTSPELRRLHGPLTTLKEVKDIADTVKMKWEAELQDRMTKHEDEVERIAIQEADGISPASDVTHAGNFFSGVKTKLQ